jgi:hypothetical protein
MSYRLLMTRLGGIHTRLLVLPALALATACGGGEGLAENVLERQLESEGVEGVDIDLDSGEFRIETEDGVIEFDEDGDGGMTIETEDGTFSQQSGSEIPDDFPSDIPRPEGTVVSTVRQLINDQLNFSLIYETGQSVVDVYEPWKADMLAAGYTASFESQASDSITSQFEDDTWQVTFSGSVFDGQTSFQLNVFPVSP